MLGRVMGFYTAMAMSTSLLGIWFFGWVTQSIGEASGLLGIGLVFLLVATTSLLFTRRMSQVKEGLLTSRRHREDAEERIGAARVASFV